MPFGILRYVFRPPVFQWSYYHGSRLYGTKTSEPLRVLFCGSDHFSCASLRALHAEQKRNPGLIASIDVLCRPGKRSGRSMKIIREVPIRAVAQELRLPIHERDTFTGWELPRPSGEPINLIVAVSFGLFVPPRILSSAEYGGLNVHPSILPNFRGPAPLQHMLLAGEKVAGVTLQTLDEKSFDHGVILAQTQYPGLQIPSPDHCTYSDLLEFITPKAAELLVRGIKDRLFVPPLVDVGWLIPTPLIHAPKITPSDRQVDWLFWDSVTIDRCHRSLGRLWSNIWINSGIARRFIFEDFEIVPRPEAMLIYQKTMDAGIGEKDVDHPVHFMIYSTRDSTERRPRAYVNDGDAIIIATRNGTAVRVKEITVDGETKKPASKVMQGTRVGASTWRVLRENKGHKKGYRWIVRENGLRKDDVS